MSFNLVLTHLVRNSVGLTIVADGSLCPASAAPHYANPERAWRHPETNREPRWAAADLTRDAANQVVFPHIQARESNRHCLRSPKGAYCNPQDPNDGDPDS